MTTLAGWMIENTVVVAIAIPFVLLLTMCRKDRPAEHNLYWLLLLVKLVLPPFYVWPMSAAEVRDRVVRTWVAAQADAPVAAPALSDIPPAADTILARPVGPLVATSQSIDDETRELANSPVIDELEVAQEGMAAAESAPQFADRTRVANASFLDLASLKVWLAVAWLFGTAIVSWRLARHVYVQRRVISNGAPAPVEFADVVGRLSREVGVVPVAIRISQHVESPSIACLGRPILIWPSRKAALAPGHDFEGVILHELAHIRRKDHWVAWLELGATLVAWWSPLFWFVRRQMHESRELACDAAVLHARPECRREYAELLLYFCAKTPPVQWALAPGQTGFLSRHSLKRRLKMIFNDRVRSRTSTLGFALAALVAAVSFPGWAWSQSREEKPALANEVSAAPPSSTAPEAAAPEETAQPRAIDNAPAAETPGNAVPPRTSGGPVNERFAPGPGAADEKSVRPPAGQPSRGRTAGPEDNRTNGPEANKWGRNRRNVPANAQEAGDNIVQEIAVPDSQQKVRISTTPQGIVTVEFDYGDGRLQWIGTFSSQGAATTPQFKTGNLTRRIDDRLPRDANLDRGQDDLRRDPLPQPGQPGSRPSAQRPDMAPGPGPANVFSKRGQRDPVAEHSAETTSERQKPNPAVEGTTGQPELVELAQISVEEKSIELDAARDEANANPGNAKLQRQLKLATLALRRAEIELGLAKSRQPADRPSDLPRGR